MGIVRISGLQMLVTSNVTENEYRIRKGIAAAAADGSDFLVTPEGALSGYTAHFDRAEVAGAVERTAEAGRKAKIGLSLGTCLRTVDGGVETCANQVRVYAPDGTYLGHYAKILRTSSLHYPGSGEMTDYVEGYPKTFEWRGVRFGVLVCNDLWATPGCTVMPNPYLPWKLWQMGAQLIIHAANSGHHQHHRAFHQASAELWSRALQVPIFGVNAFSNPHEPINAPSGLVLPDGSRVPDVSDIGEQFFTSQVEV